ncbi:WD repeat- and FYVE domain-containing protein 4 isoform X1 [Ictalurus punctatus]|uniref:WD repeat- and FYVE domain-containing protein 4 isoform X1 n=1 Tax=Ictalurus punctatus TaxID=7998 RepID=A0A2D0QMF1_ICTPU|nr:WD repeat- and FYVE domain-containing protein 4 isoform X1 [Ictalurus punctatus]XP_017319577.1 WD repeat- and FYVE domain-containing protein 4 isoform X1 [Ictalurus punctatus]
MERINKETGELSASGECIESIELKSDEPQMEPGDEEDSCTGLDAATALEDQLLELAKASAEQREEQLLLLLPIFIQVYESNRPTEDLDLQSLATQVTETLVFHIQKRVAEKPAEQARAELEQFFQQAEHGRCKGWLLLKAISILSTSDAGVNAAIVTGLASALVKCLYLFVALSAKKASDQEDDKCSFQDVLIQVILQLCRQVRFVEQLVETEELQCLIIALTSLWDQCSSSWRRQVSRVLRAVSAVQVPNTVPALQAKNCVKICIQNMLKMSEHVHGLILAEVAVNVFSFVKDSYPNNPALFEEFENNDGYTVLQAIMERCEEETSEEDFSPVQDLLGLIASFTLFGKAELKVALCVNNPQPPGFKFDPPLITGTAVKNLRAFQILQSSFLRSGSALTCSQILCTIHTIWSWDKANFFLLEWTLQCLAQLADSTWQKPATVHSFFFKLLETVVFQLSYIPHDTLRKVQAVLKEGSSQAFSMAALKCFHGMVMSSSLLSDVLSDGGLMDLLLVELRRRAKILRKANISVTKGELRMEDCERQLTTNMLNVVAALAMRSIRNSVFIRDSGMIPYIKIFLDDEMYRSPTLCILEQLSEMNPEEYMSTTIGALCSSTETELQLKQDLLRSILKVLDNSNSWNAFRTAGGFTSLLSMLVDMEGALLQQPAGVWASLSHQGLMELLLLTLHTMAMAVHLHPVNAHFFHITNLYERMAEALLQIGCFLGGAPVDLDTTKDYRTFQDFLKLTESSGCPLPAPMHDCIRVLDFLEQFGTGISRATDLCTELKESTEIEENQQEVTSHKTGEDDFQGQIRKAALSISSVTVESGRFSCDHTILHPGAVKVIMSLLPHIYCPSNPQLSVEIQLAVAHHVQSLVKSERNRQIMCESGMLETLLSHCRDILSNSTHSLHLPVVRILEKLASQSIDHKSLRQFLCLQAPLTCSTEKCISSPVSEDDPPQQNPLSNGHCANHGIEEGEKTSSEKKRWTPKRSFSLLNTASTSRTPVPLHQIISLVSITSPRSFRPHKVSVSPSFVEFDMTDSGYGCLFLPSLATVKGVSADNIPTGGIGGDCRGFPPSAGLSFSCWFLISRFSSACDSHPVRLLTVVRHMSRAEQHFSCLSVSISSSDGCLVITTEEEAYQFLDMMEPMSGTPTALPTTVRFKCSKQLMPGLWHHLVVTMAKDIKKSCKVTAYLNGEVIGISKMRYIQPFPGSCIAMDASAVIDVCGIIGTPPIWKQHAALIWRVGPTYLFEEVLSSVSVERMYAQGTRYLGSYLAIDAQANGKIPFSPVRLVPPERISFGINPAVSTVTTVAEIRDQFNEVDCRLIAKEIGIPSRDNSTPVFLARNISQHLSGTARTIGAALVGHFGVRTFTSNTASSSFQYIGGPAVVLSLVAMATDDSSLYAAVKVLLSVLDTNPVMKQEMKRISGYKLFAFLLKMKAHLISCRTFQLILAIVGTVELGTGNVHVHDLTALQGILCNFEVWQKAPESLDLSVLNHFVDILSSSSGDPRNAEAIHSLNLMMKLLCLLQDPTVTHRKVTVICTIITCLLQKHFNPKDIHRLGLFLIHTLLPPTVNEKTAFPFEICEDQSQALSQTPGRTIWIRNQLLEVLSSLIISDTPLPNNEQEDMFSILGSDWFFLFLQGHIHSSTMLLVLKMLVHFLSHQNIRAKFKEAVSSGTLVENLHVPLGITDNLQMRSWSYGCLSGTFPGFTVLTSLLLNHISLPQIYRVFAALLFGKSDFHVPDGQVDLDSMLQSVIDGSANEKGVHLCTEAACVLIELVKMIICKPITGSEDSWDVQYPGSVMQFLCLVHSNFPRDALWASSDFLNCLASAVFPTEITENAAGPQSNEDVEDTSAPRLSHPARKQVCDFIRILLMDSLINIPAKDQHHPFIQLLEFSPENVCHEQKQSFQSELLEFLMDIIHITGQEGGQSTHVARDDSSKYSSEGKFTILSENVAFFSKMLVEKLYNGMFVVDPENLLVFVVEQIAVALETRQHQHEATVPILYKSLNRAVLYFLSRPRQAPAEKELILRTLHVLQQHWDIIMATYNASVHFISCLLHCLLLIRSGSFPEGFGCEMHKKPSRKLWRHLFPHKNNQMMAPVDIPSSAEVESELLKLVESTWDKVMQERRHSLEEAYKIDLSAKQAGKETLVSMSDVSPLWEEIAMKSWQVFIDSQKKKLNIGQRKISILISRSPQRTPEKDPDSNVETFLEDIEVHRKIGEEMFETLLKNYMQALHCENELMAARWLRIEQDLLRERGMFGPGPGVFINQGWVQDAAEGPNRTRLRIRRKAARRSKKLPCLMPGQYMKHSTVDESRGVAEFGIADAELRILSESGREAEKMPNLDCEHLTFFPSLTEVSSPTEDISEECMESQLIIQQLAPNEEIKVKQCVAVVSGHMLVEGVLLFGKADLYVCEGFTLTSSGDVCCGNHHPTSVRDSFICGMLKKEQSSVNPACRRWSYEDIKEARFMRFLLEENAIEIFMKKGASVFLVFVNKDHVSAFKRLCSVVPSLKGRGVTEAVHNVRKTAALDKTVIAKWQKGEMNNFEYLMHLNTLAGRTYNDLMQYPVFPWIIADYESETLDLSSPTSFRDLSKPMGAQNEKRREKFIQRYNEVDSNDGELSAQCHYCTHYSSGIIVASYLVRMEPFSQTFLSLQGGSFDVPERMFYSMQKEWESASKDNMSDVREIIPEFFYLPDFLINSNNFEFGCMQDGTSLGDVVLPPWAKGDPQEFIRMHREALESDYVSANLHLWIDLIFGYKQQGPAAVEALNVFHPYFYTDKHDAESMRNPLKKSTVLGYISNFGQIPKQLFTKPHPSRIVHKSSTTKEMTGTNHITPFFFKLDKLKPSVQPLKELIHGPVGQIICGERDLLAVVKNKLLMPPLWNTYFCWGYYDNTCSFGNYTTEKDFGVWEGLSDWGEAVCAACPNSNVIITAGSSTVVCVWDVSISKDKLKYMRLKEALYGHTDTVTCVVVSETHSVIISGSQDQTCILWDLEDLNYITQLPAHSSSVTALAINDLTGEIVSCSGTNLYLWTMKGQLLASVNTPYGPEGSILCCCFTQKYEWDPRNVIITGCADGIVRIWKTEYTKVQLPGHEEYSASRGDAVSLSAEDTERTRTRWERHLVLCRELNRSQIITRRRYKNNPAVTALAISRTHGTLLVGDAWGRVFSWTSED